MHRAGCRRLPLRYEPLGRLNVICPYYTMFPLSFPFNNLRKAGSESYVLDPFCGRGTTIYAARLLGLQAVGVDVSAVAVAIAAAKLVTVKPSDVVARCQEIFRKPPSAIEIPDGDFWKWCFDPDTLLEICILRDYLRSHKLDHEALALRALVLGLLHGPRSKHSDSYLSNQMPRTYATKPDAAVEFWERNRMRPRRVDTMRLVRKRAEYLFEALPPGTDACVIRGDARTARIGKGRKFTHIITSPPYLGMRCYVPDQWLRNWFLGADQDVDYSESSQMGSNKRDEFIGQLARVWTNVARACAPGARLIVRFGALPSVIADPAEIVRRSLRESEGAWKAVTSRPVSRLPRSRRQANQFGRDLPEPLREVDLYAKLEG